MNPNRPPHGAVCFMCAVNCTLWIPAFAGMTAGTYTLNLSCPPGAPRARASTPPDDHRENATFPVCAGSRWLTAVARATIVDETQFVAQPSSILPLTNSKGLVVLAKVLSCAVIGLDAELVQVEVDIATGLERMTLVGLPDAAVRESSERVRAAITNSGFFFPSHRLTINLAPADLRKEGPAYDLPIAVGILAATRQVQDPLDDALILGELSLDGSVRHVKGTLPMANTAVQRGYRRLFVPASDALEAALVPGIDVYPIHTLAELVHHLQGVALICQTG